MCCAEKEKRSSRLASLPRVPDVPTGRYAGTPSILSTVVKLYPAVLSSSTTSFTASTVWDRSPALALRGVERDVQPRERVGIGEMCRNRRHIGRRISGRRPLTEWERSLPLQTVS